MSVDCGEERRIGTHLCASGNNTAEDAEDAESGVGLDLKSTTEHRDCQPIYFEANNGCVGSF